jgi:hypothetical protein
VQQLDVEPRPPHPITRPRRWAQAIATAACTGAVIVAPKSIDPAIKVPLILLGTILAIDLSRREARDPGDPRPIVGAISGLFALAVVITPKFATDIWSFTIVGRTLAVHHLNPYRVAPAALAHDPLLPFLHVTWRSGTTPYGPLFVLHSALVALVSGTHPLLYRLAFQSTSAIAIGAALWLLWRANHSTASLALIGLHPVVAGSIVNGGHNDALLALALLGIVLLVARGRTVGAGWLLLAAMLVKVTMAYAIIPIAVWTATRHGRRAMFRFLAPTIVGMPLMALIPGALHSMTAANSGVVTRLAVWNVFIRVSWLEIPGLHPSNYLTAGLIAVVVIIAIAALIGRRQSDPGPGAAVGAAGWLVGAGYVLAWYTVFGFVVSALRPTSRLARWFALQGGVITAAYLIPRDRLTTSPIVGTIVSVYVPLALAAAFVWALMEYRTSPTATA